MIRINLAENVYFNMAKKKNAYELSEKLHALYGKKSSPSKLILIQHLFNTRMKGIPLPVTDRTRLPEP